MTWGAVMLLGSWAWAGVADAGFRDVKAQSFKDKWTVCVCESTTVDRTFVVWRFACDTFPETASSPLAPAPAPPGEASTSGRKALRERLLGVTMLWLA